MGRTAELADLKEKQYPSHDEVDAWITDIIKEAEKAVVTVEELSDREYGFTPTERHTKGRRYVRFNIKGMTPFYCYWQPVQSGAPSPLLVHLPGYGAEMSEHPELVLQGFSVIHINPLGYATPQGFDDSQKVNGQWPVMRDTFQSRGERGYKQWLINCIIAVRWAWTQMEVLPGRVSFFGSSQGGGMSLLLGSVFRDMGIRCVAADVPYFIQLGEYFMLEDCPPDLYSMGLVDVLSHLHRLAAPVMLTAGGIDRVCCAEPIKLLFDRLNTTKLLCHIPGQDHDYTAPFIVLASAWFRLYA